MAKKIDLSKLIVGEAKALDTFVKSLEDLNKQIDLLTTSVSSKKKDVSDFVDMFAKSNPNTKEGIELINKLTKEFGDYAKLVKQIEKLEKDLAKAKETVNKTDKETLRAKVELAEANRNARQALKDEIELSKIAKDSLKAQEIELRKLRNEYAKFSQEAKKSDAAVIKMKSDIDKLTESTKKQRTELGQHQVEVGNYGKALKGVGTNLLSMAGALGLVTTGLEVASIAFTKITTLNKDLKTTQSILGGTAVEVQNATAAISALSTKFGADFNEALKTTNILTQEFGKSNGEVITGLTELYAQNADIGGNLLNDLGQYAPKLKRAGATIEDINKIALASAKGGIFDDKLYDTAYEGFLRIAEAVEDTNSTYAKSLRSLGAVGNEIIKTFQSGDKLGAVQKLAGEISRLEKAGISAQKPLSEMFGDPGESLSDRGLEILATLEKFTPTLSEQEKATIILTKAHEGLNKQVLELSSNFKGTGTFLETVFVEALSGIIEEVNFLSDAFVDLFNEFKNTNEFQREVDKLAASYSNFIETLSSENVKRMSSDTVKEIQRLNKEIAKAQKEGSKEVEESLLIDRAAREQSLLVMEKHIQATEAQTAKELALKDATKKEGYNEQLRIRQELAVKLAASLREMNTEIDASLNKAIEPSKALEKTKDNSIGVDLSGLGVEDITVSAEESLTNRTLREEEKALADATEQRKKYTEAFAEQMKLSAETQDIRKEELRLNYEIGASLATLAVEQIAYSNSFGEFIENITKAAIKSLAPQIAQFAASQIAKINLPPPAGIVLAGAVVGAASVALSRIRAFKDGVFDINTANEYGGSIGISHPNGKRGVDVIPAWLNEGETVLQAEQTQAYRHSLEAMVGKKGDAEVMRGILKDVGMTEEKLIQTKFIGQSVNYEAITAATKLGVKQGIAEQTQYITDIRDGELNKYIKSKNTIVNLKNKRNGF